MNIGGNFHLNGRTGQVEYKRKQEKGANEIFREVKARRFDLIARHNITDQELRMMIHRVKNGIRNVMYLAVGEDRERLYDIATYIVAEYAN